jgi:hypothetical protein
MNHTTFLLTMMLFPCPSMLVFLLLGCDGQEDQHEIYMSCLFSELGLEPYTEERKFLATATCCSKYIAACEELYMFEGECPDALRSNATAGDEAIVRHGCEIFCAGLDELRFEWCPVPNTPDFADSPSVKISELADSAPATTLEHGDSRVLRTFEPADSPLPKTLELGDSRVPRTFEPADSPLPKTSELTNSPFVNTLEFADSAPPRTFELADSPLPKASELADSPFVNTLEFADSAPPRTFELADSHGPISSLIAITSMTPGSVETFVELETVSSVTAMVAMNQTPAGGHAESRKEGSVSESLVAGVVIGGLVVAVTAVLAVCFIMRRKPQNEEEERSGKDIMPESLLDEIEGENPLTVAGTAVNDGFEL